MNKKRIINVSKYISNIPDRHIRVFISSTFRDMMRERDLLVKEVFPELRRKCAKRFVTFTEVDLRWGITEAQANEGQVLPLCLAEIERSRPYFIGLLGERYGWIPDTINPEVIAKEPWLQEHIQGRTSVTELEILYGVLNNPQMQCHAFFYFRDSAYVNNPSLPADERQDMIERNITCDVEKYGEAEATRRTEERKVKLATLKQRIRNSNLPLVESYANPHVLAELIRKQFDELIDQLYPEDQLPDLLTQERLAHEAFARTKLFACIDRPTHLAEINGFVTSTERKGKGFVVTGESGSGKSALLASWANQWSKSHPMDFLFQHYMGATPDSSLPEGFLHRLLGELKSNFGIKEDIPTDPEKLRNALPVWLAQASTKVSSLTAEDANTVDETALILPVHIVLVIDGLNQIQDTEPERRLNFLPLWLPPNVVVLTSTLKGSALEILRKYGWVEHDLPPANETEVDAIIDKYLKIHARALEPELRKELIKAPGSKNLLFLRTVLEELRQFGSYERLPQHISHYLEANNPIDLFRRVLTRWQEDFNSKYPEQNKPNFDLVRYALTDLWAARQGLSEPEWLNILGMNIASSQDPSPLPRAFWTPFFLALEPHLSQRGGLYTFSHNYLREAVESKFLADEAERHAKHLEIAHYFRLQEINPRRVAEEPWQLLEAGDLGSLMEIIANLNFSHSIFTQEKQSLLRYWARLEERTPNRIAKIYYTVIEKPEQAQQHLGWVAYLLKINGDKKNLLRLLEARVHLARSSSDSHALLDCLIDLALMYFDKSPTSPFEVSTDIEEINQQKPMKLLHEHEDIASRIGDKKSLQAGLGTQAQLLIWNNQYFLARNLLERQQKICEEIGDRPGLARCFANLAFVHNALFEETAALSLFEQAEDVWREVCDLASLAETLDSHGQVYADLHRPYEAIVFWQEELKLAESIGFKYIQRLALGKLDQTYSYLGADEAALLLLGKEETLCVELDDLETLKRCQMRRRIIAESICTDNPDHVLMQEFPVYTDNARKKGIESILNTIADSRAQFFPRQHVIADIQIHFLRFITTEAFLGSAHTNKLDNVSVEEFKKQWNSTFKLIESFAEALYNNSRFLEQIAIDNSFRSVLQKISIRLLLDVFPVMGYSEMEKQERIEPLNRCIKLLIND
jgi:hypothetical protein